MRYTLVPIYTQNDSHEAIQHRSEECLHIIPPKSVLSGGDQVKVDNSQNEAME